MTRTAPTDAPEEVPSRYGSARGVAHRGLHGDADHGKSCADDSGEEHPGQPDKPNDVVLPRGPVPGGQAKDMGGDDVPDCDRRNVDRPDGDGEGNREQRREAQRSENHTQAQAPGLFGRPGGMGSCRGLGIQVLPTADRQAG